MKTLLLLFITLLSFESQSYDESEIIKYQFKTDITTDIYIRTGKGEHSCGGTVSISAFYYEFDEYIDAVIFGRGGQIKGTWVIDSDNDNNPEIFVWVQSCGSGGLGNIYSYELITYDDKNVRRNRGKIKWVKLNIPRPSEYMENYRGRDSFKVLNDGLIRKFPQYNKSDSNARPSKEPMTLKYLFKEQKWLALDKLD